LIHDETGPLDEIFRDMRKARFREAGPPSFSGHEVLDEIGEGGFGLVYRARDKKLERDVALKVLLPLPGGDGGAGARFLNEARALARVRHPNVVTLYGILEENGAKALSTELIRGRSLDRVIQEEGPLQPAEAARIGIDVARALEAVHAAGVIHRDVKSTNVMLEDGGRTVLADFGLGVFLSRPGPDGAAGSAAGAPLFMSPEQARGGPVDPRTDIYSLGVLLYHILSGDFPHRADDIETLFARVRERKAAPLE
jgi:serine/threonine protein kinase